MKNAEQFLQAMAGAGLIYSGDLIPDGQLHRFDAEGDKRGKKNSWYVLHDDGLPAGAFGCWQRGLSETWSAKPEQEYSPAEREQFRQRMESMKRQREQEQVAKQKQAKSKAVKMWEAARKIETSKGHFYTAAKCVQPVGVRVLKALLLVPVYSPAGELVSLQLISKSEAGETIKRFLSGTPLAGNYCPIGKAAGACEALAIGEGWATMASVHMATGWPCVAAFSAGNLEPVARVMRAKFPAAKLVLCADDDNKTQNKTGINPGLVAAQKAARAVGGLVALPWRASVEVAV
jgi:putative DNA primase/helicase